MNIEMIVILCILGAILLLGVLPSLVMGWVLYRALFKRGVRENWDRGPQVTDDPVYLSMYNEGQEFLRENEAFRKPVQIENDGLRLYGEYLDFGFDKAVIILAGRMETCLYSFYFAAPYKAAGYNILTIDNRSHGLSDGRYNALGFQEYKDVLRWAAFLHDECGIQSVVIHGICIGSETAVFAATAKNTPPYLSGIVTEGMFTRFYDLFKEQLRVRKKPVFPFALSVMFWAMALSHAHPVTDGPEKRIGALSVPILFLHSEKDRFSLPGNAERLYEDCGAERKKIVFFESGEHSRVRYLHKERYDGEIDAFLKRLEGGSQA